METNKQLYPLKFIPIASRKVWGGNRLTSSLGKKFTEEGQDGRETSLTPDDKIGESLEIIDTGMDESVVSEGWLAGNTIEDVMETYLERVVGEDVYQYYGRQFPLLVKFLDICDRLSVKVHPDDETAEQRYDALGKSEMWYVLEAAPDAKIFMGFKRATSAQELYDRCLNGTIKEILNVIYPKKGDVFYIKPGTVHAAGGGLLIAEIGESSALNFRLYDWERGSDPSTARQMHLEEAIDIIDYEAFDESLYIRAGESEDGGTDCRCRHDEGHGHEDGHEGVHREEEIVRKIVRSKEFTVNELKVSDPLHIYTEKFGRFIIYVCIEGEVSIQVPSTDEKGVKKMDNHYLKKGETILIPADMPDFFIVPVDRGSRLLEAMVEKFEEEDDYIDPDTEPYLEGEDYEGLDEECEHECEDECCCGHHHEDHEDHVCSCNHHKS